jgi:hypothetical protein
MTNYSLSKIKHVSFAFALTLITLFSFNNNVDSLNSQAQLLNSCMAVESNLPMNHTNHPCYTSSMSNQSWLSWLSGGSESTHLHFLDLIELINYSFR